MLRFELEPKIQNTPEKQVGIGNIFYFILWMNTNILTRDLFVAGNQLVRCQATNDTEHIVNRKWRTNKYLWCSLKAMPQQLGWLGAL